MPQDFPQPLVLKGDATTPALSFNNTTELRTFIDREAAFWQFLDAKTQSRNSANAGQARYPLDRLRAVGKSLKNYESGATDFSAVREEVLQTFSRTGTKIPIGDSPDAQFLKGLASELPDEPYYIAVAHVLRRANQISINVQSEDHMIGLVAAINYRLGHTPETARAAMAALEELRVRHATLLRADEDNLTQQREAWTSALESYRTEAGAMVEDASAAHAEQRAQSEEQTRQLIDTLTKQNTDAKTEWDNTLKAFIEQMRLKASTTYWSDKRVEHRKRAKMWGWIAASYAIAATAFMVWGIDTEYARLLEMDTSTPLGAYVALAARGLIISVVAFWIARIIVRMFLSELHLAMDSYERSTMVSTYLALTQDGKIDEKERALVLAPLFRPTADGWVKDDASTDANVQNMLAMIKGK